MAKVKNISDGPRGAYADGTLVFADPGEMIEADDYAKEWFAPARGKAAAADADDDALPRNVPTLRSIAKAEAIDLGHAKSADDIIAAIDAARAAKAEPADEE